MVVLCSLCETILRSAILALCLRFPVASTTACSSFDNKIRDGQCVEFLLSQPSCVLCGNQACTTRTKDDAFCPILQETETLNFGTGLGQLETFHARVGNDAKRLQSALCTMDDNCFVCDPTWAQDVCVQRSMSLSSPL